MDRAQLPMTREGLLAYLQSQCLAVEASVSQEGNPQAALVGIAVTDNFEVVFDTVVTSRKVANLRHKPTIALVMGGMEQGDERTVQYEGVADQPSGTELETLKEIYYGAYPDGRDRQSWPGLTYIRVSPTWIRYSDFNQDPPLVVEFDKQAISRLR